MVCNDRVTASQRLGEDVVVLPGPIEPSSQHRRHMQILVNIDVDDPERAIEFYEAALGLRAHRGLFAGSVVEMHGASSTIYLLSKAPGSAAVPHTQLTRDYQRHWTPVHLDFTVEDIFAAVERAVSAGANLEGEVQSFAWGHLARMSDPFGHGFCLLQFLGRGYDEVAAQVA
jgi:predicted enzyme related to lactoylglutathione lyase